MNQKVIIATIVGVILVLIGLIFLIDRLEILKPQEKPQPSVFVPPPTPTPIDGDTIIFTGLKFTPGTMEIKLSQVVNIANLGDFDINIQGVGGGEADKLSVGALKPGDTSEFVKFNKAGIYEYRDNVNPSYKGRIIVK